MITEKVAERLRLDVELIDDEIKALEEAIQSAFIFKEKNPDVDNFNIEKSIDDNKYVLNDLIETKRDIVKILAVRDIAEQFNVTAFMRFIKFMNLGNGKSNEKITERLKLDLELIDDEIQMLKESNSAGSFWLLCLSKGKQERLKELMEDNKKIMEYLIQSKCDIENLLKNMSCSTTDQSDEAAIN